MRNLRIGNRRGRPPDRLRLGLLHVILNRLRALNENTNRLLRLLDADWNSIKARFRSD